MAVRPRPLRRWRVLLLATALMVGLLPLTPVAADVPADRLSGPERIGTAIAVSRAGFPTAPAVVLAMADDFADALTAGGLAARLGGPLLLVPRDVLPEAVAEELLRLQPTTAWVVGGPAAVDEAVAAAVAGLGIEVRRLAGDDRFATAAAVADELGGEGPRLLALGAHEDPSRAWPDALSAGALTAAGGSPLLLTQPDALPAATAQRLGAGEQVTLIGGTAAISEGVADELAQLGVAVERLAGPDRYATSVAVADRALRDLRDPSRETAGPRPLVVASGAGYADALPAAALAARLAGVLLLVPPGDLTGAAVLETWLRDHAEAFDRVVVIGGTQAVSDLVVAQLRALLDGQPAPAPDPDPDPEPTPAPSPSPTPDIPPAGDEGEDDGGGGGGGGGTPPPPPPPGPSPSPPPPGPTPPPPPPPEEHDAIAPPLDPTVPTTTAALVEWLYTGDDPLQTGVAADTIVPRRAALVGGRVLDTAGEPLQGVTATIVDHPEYGQTQTREDGQFDLAVNGGGELVVDLRAPGHLPVQRRVALQWGDMTVLDDVVLTALDTAVTTVDLSGGTTGWQVHAATPVTDDDGTRQAVAMIPPGTTATMTLPDGRTVPLTQGSMRITEFTVGDLGPQAMPGDLPAATAYTWAAEVSFDEALTAGATTVTFDQPVVVHLDDFIGMGPGALVPVGTYDRATGHWLPEQDGVVVRVLSVTDGLADLDVDGEEPAAADPDLYPLLGITDGERRLLADRYQPGDTVARVTHTHFTPTDYNYLYHHGVPEEDVPRPNQPEGETEEGDEDPTGNDCGEEGSVIGCDDRTLGETLPVVDTPYVLTYASDRVPGDQRAFTLAVPVTGADVPELLEGARVSVSYAGYRVTDVVGAEPNQTRHHTWPGRDRWGRALTGAVPVQVAITYDYAVDGAYMRALMAADGVVGSSWGLSTAELGGRVRSFGPVVDDRLTVSQAQDYRLLVRITNSAQRVATGGWTFDVHHTLDPVTQTVQLGDGTEQSATAGDAFEVLDVVGELPVRAAAVDVLGDGTLVTADDHAVYRVAPGGSPSVVADGFVHIADLAVAGDGAIAVADDGANRVWVIDPDGTRRHVAGNGTTARASTEPVDAVTAAFPEPSRLAWTRDGSLLVGDGTLVRRIGLGGQATTLLDTQRFVSGLAVDATGSIHVATPEPGALIRITPTGEVVDVLSGEITRMATAADGTVVAVAGEVVIAIGHDGLVRPVAGGGVLDGCSDLAGVGARMAGLCEPHDVAVTPDGLVVIADAHRLVMVAGVVPDHLDGLTPVASADGSEIWTFDAIGNHVETRDALTGDLLRTFTYDHGRLVAITERGGRTTTIERDDAGHPTAIVAPSGRRTELETDADGWVTAVTDPGGRHTELGYGTGGLLTSLREPSGSLHEYVYDASGALRFDHAPGGRTTELRLIGHRTVLHLDPEGRATLYTTTVDEETGIVTRRVTEPDGLQTVSITRPDGVSVLIAPGETVVVALAPDPRFGMSAPYAATVTRTRPDGTAGTRTETREVSLADEHDPFTVVTATTAVTVVGQGTTTGVWQAADRTYRLTSPEGRTFTATYDAAGRLASEQVDDLLPVTYGYDDLGRLTAVVQGDRATVYGYEGTGDRVTARTWTAAVDGVPAPGGATTAYGYDESGNLTSVTTPEGHEAAFTYDDDGRVSSLTRPEEQVHELAWSAADRLVGLTTPTGATYVVGRDLDSLRTSTTVPGGAVQEVRSEDGRPTGTVQREADGQVSSTTTLTYQPGTEVLDLVTRTTTDPSRDVAIDHTAAGRLVTGAAFSGAVDGTFAYTYDDLGQLASVALDGAAPSAVTWDDDGLLVGWGDAVIHRDGPGGEVSGVTYGPVTATFTTDAFGGVGERAFAVGGTEVVETITARDHTGRITARTVTVDGATTQWSYAYDGDGRLTAVTRDGEVVEAYTYDGNGNRTSRLDVDGEVVGVTPGDDDRTIAVDGRTVAYDDAGNLASWRGIAFAHDGRGELVTATLPDGSVVTYAYDGLGRRVARTHDGATTQYLYGNPLDVLQVTAVRTAEGHLLELVHDTQQRLVGFDRDGVRYGVATDHLGTPLAIVDADGTVVWERTLSAFGEVLAEAGDRLGLPIGFAGGLEDPDVGIVRFGVRDYDPTLGQWLARDRALFAGGQGNLYAYAATDPVNLVDRTGLATLSVGAGLGLYLGIKLGITSDGFSFCWEGGVGIGASVETDLDAGLDAGGRTGLIADVGVGVGAATVSANVEYDFGENGCPGDLRPEGKVCVAILCGKVNRDGLGGNNTFVEVPGLKVAAKATAVTCTAGTWD